MLLDILLFLIIYIIIKCLVFYIKRIQTHRIFTNNGIKGPKPSIITGNYYQMKDNPNKTFDEWIEEYGNCFGYFIADRPILMINDLDSIQAILINNNKQFRDRPKYAIKAKPIDSSLIALSGDRWRHVRRVITPFFSHHKINSKEMTDNLIESINTCIKNIEKQKDSVVRVDDRMYSITLDIICKCVLNMSDTDIHEENSQLRSSAKEYMETANNVVVRGATFFPFLRPALEFFNNYLTAGRMIDTILLHINRQIETETQNMSSKPNYLINTKTNNVLKSLVKSFLDQNLRREEVTGNALVLLLAGSDTTTLGLMYTLYALAKNPEIQDRLRTEINSNDSKFEYLDQIWCESLRLYSILISFVQREAAEDVVLNDVVIPKGTTIQFPLWHIHHDPDIWSQPYRFDPQRFAPENREHRHPASFLMFGLGPRNCIGQQLAQQMARHTISMIVEKFSIEVCEQTADPLEFCVKADTLLYPKIPLFLRFVPLNHT